MFSPNQDEGSVQQDELLHFLESESVFATVSDVEETIVVFVFVVDNSHSRTDKR